MRQWQIQFFQSFALRFPLIKQDRLIIDISTDKVFKFINEIGQSERWVKNIEKNFPNRNWGAWDYHLPQARDISKDKAKFFVPSALIGCFHPDNAAQENNIATLYDYYKVHKIHRALISLIITSLAPRGIIFSNYADNYLTSLKANKKLDDPVIELLNFSRRYFLPWSEYLSMKDKLW